MSATTSGPFRDLIDRRLLHAVFQLAARGWKTAERLATERGGALGDIVIQTK